MAYLGDFFIFSAAVCSVSSLIFYFLAWRGKDFLNLARNFFRLTSFFITLTLAAMLYLILTHDFSVAYVHSYSSTDLPLGYLIASLWGGQEGTFILWIFYVAIMGLVVIKSSGKFEKGNMFFINLFILSIILILIKKSPFELLPVFRTEGAGLNPLLQNFWMQIHPPIMFVGFAGALFPFCFALTGLVERKYDQWAESARRWTMFAWGTLGVSLIMGGYWAYETLGWGGFWAWDPVENSSFIPWIFLSTQIHVLFIKRQRKGLMRFSLFMVCLSFWSVLYGTFLTRSGVLADFSVHSFIDLGINNFLIGGLFFFMAIGFSLLIYRWQDITPNPSYSKVKSRSYLVTLGILLLFFGGLLTLLGTSAPLLTRMAENPSAVGIPYYFITMMPIAIGVLILLGLFPAFKWNNGISKPRLIMISVIIALTIIAGLVISGFTHNFVYLLFFGAVGMALTSNSYVVFMSWREKNFKPGYLAHIGIALALTGAAVSAGFETKKTITLPKNQEVKEMGFTLKFVDITDRPIGFDCHVDIKGDGREFTAVLSHEFPSNAEGVMRKPHIEKYITQDIYIAPIALEQSGPDDPNMIEFEKKETIAIDKYEFTFHDFDLARHGEGGMTKAVALMTVKYDGRTEKVQPALEVRGDSVVSLPASFDYEKGIVSIVGVKPDNGSVLLKLSGGFMPQPVTSEASLVIELTRKPLINLFWIGSIICFLSGALSMRKRNRKKKTSVSEKVSIAEQKKETVL